MCVAKPVTVELCCHATALIFALHLPYVRTDNNHFCIDSCESVFIRLAVSSRAICLFLILAIYHFGFEGKILALSVPFSVDCLSFTFYKLKCMYMYMYSDEF